MFLYLIYIGICGELIRKKFASFEENVYFCRCNSKHQQYGYRSNKNQLVERNFKRNEMLAEYFFGLSKMVCSGIGIGALSPLFTGEAMGVTNIVCMGCAVIAAACFAYAGNYLLKVELKKK